MNLILCDDEQVFLNSLSEKIMAWAERTGHMRGIMLHCFTSSEDLLEAWQNGMAVDALFLDMQIPGEMNGLALAKEIHSTDERLPIVFITNYGEYAVEGYKVNALRYLHKPVSDQAIFECMDILWNRWSLRRADCVVIDLPTQILRLPVDTILYIEASGHYCVLNTADVHQTYKVKDSLGVLSKKLPSHLFVQCHRSFVVNLVYIRNITRMNLVMGNGTTIQMSRNYKSQLIEKFRQYYLGGREE